MLDTHLHFDLIINYVSITTKMHFFAVFLTYNTYFVTHIANTVMLTFKGKYRQHTNFSIDARSVA